MKLNREKVAHIGDILNLILACSVLVVGIILKIMGVE